MRRTGPFSSKGARLAALGIWLVGSFGVESANAAGGALEAHYEVVSSVERGDGTYDVTFDFTVTNAGSEDYADLALTLLGSGPAVCLGSADAIPVGPLMVAETATATRTLSFIAPIESHTDLRFEGFGRESDETGDPVFLQIQAQEDSQ